MYQLYQQARDMSWKVLIECGITSLPVDLGLVAERYHIKIISYSQCPLTRFFSLEVISGDGFAAEIGGQYFVFINDQMKNRPRRRFTVAHELGHILLGQDMHLIKARNSELDDNKDPFETQANIFARDLLAPACVIAAFHLHTPEEISNLCDISFTSAKVRAERMKLLYRRNVFLSHPLEKKVLQQFKNFIEGR